jgi:peptide/nickel transport system substrate-binding protein
LGFIVQRGHYDSAPLKADGKKDFGAVKANGTGPYRITELKPGDYIHMVRNTEYFRNGPKGFPAIGALRFRTIKDQNTRTAELMTGRIDWIWDVPKDQADRLKANPAITIENAKTLRVAYLAMDVKGASGVKFFGDRRVRQALAHAINRDLIAKTFMGPASAAIEAACHPDQFGCSGNVQRYEYSPDKARALLKEAGYAGGFEFNLYAYRDRELSEAVIGDLVRVGIKPRLNFLQYTPWLEAVRKGAATVAHGTWGSNSIPDVSAIAAHFFGGGPDDLVKDEQVIAMIAQADAQTEPERRRELWQKALARIASEAYWVPLYAYSKYYAYSKELDFKPTSDEMPQFYAARWR